MELDVTHMMQDSDEMPMLSGSVAELGKDAGKVTWNNSKAYAAEKPLLETDEQREAARNHFGEYGAWSDDEIAAWSEEELQAIVCQEVAAEIREFDRFDTTAEYEQASHEGQVSGRLYQGTDGRWYCYFGT
jgi:hypothetical protein